MSTDFKKKRWQVQEMTAARALRLNKAVCAWARAASPVLRGDGSFDLSGAEARAMPRESLSDLVRMRWVLLKERKEERLPKSFKPASEALCAVLVALRDAPTGLPVLVSGGRALSITRAAGADENF